MKLLRYGPIGQEKPGILSADGKIRDLSAVVSDISANTLANDALEKIRKVDPASLPAVAGESRVGACVGGWASLSASGSTTPITQPRLEWLCLRSP